MLGVAACAAASVTGIGMGAETGTIAASSGVAAEWPDGPPLRVLVDARDIRPTAGQVRQSVLPQARDAWTNVFGRVTGTALVQ